MPTLLAASVGLARRNLHRTAHQHHPKLPRLNSSSGFTHGSPISLNLIIPPSIQPQVVIASTIGELDDLVKKTYRGTLRSSDSNGTTRIILRSCYPELSPTEIYEIVSPYFNAEKEDRLHHQLADKAFEEKSRNCLFKFLNDKGIKYRELDRTIKKDGKTVAEWEAIVETDSGQIMLLECKHCVTSVLYSLTFSNTNVEGDSRTGLQDA